MPIMLAYDKDIEAMALHDLRLRMPYIDTTNHLHGELSSWRAIKGFITQHHVTEFFKNKVPSLFVHASNYGRPSNRASDDFRVRLPGGMISIDVASAQVGVNILRWTVMRKKVGQDYHILADLKPQENVIIYGYVTGLSWDQKNGSYIYPEETLPIEDLLRQWKRLIVHAS